MTVQRVDPPALTSQAAEMKGQNWHNPAEDAVVPPDAVPSTNDAIANLNENAQSLKEFEEWAKLENQRIAETLEIAAAAYQKVDDHYGNALDNPERAAAIDAISVPSPQTPPPEIPGPASTPRLLDASGYSDVKKTQDELTAPDTGASLKNAMLYWFAATNRVKNNKPKPPPGDWEGDAADAAYARMTTFGNWLDQLSDAWSDLGEAAAKLLEAHDTAKSAHQPIYDEYIELEKRMAALVELAKVPGTDGGQARREIDQVARQMEELQKRSDEVRQDYASDATFAPVRPGDPPGARADSVAPAGGPGGGQGGGGDQPTDDPATMAQKMGESMGTVQPQSEAGQGGGSGGGSPSGGESPSGGAGSGGSPGGAEGGGSPTGTPRTPTDPSLRPAASGGSGGGSGGGAGGGVGSAPLSPAVSAETVAPAPPMPVSAGSAPAAAAAPGGGMAGGMGGMAPMHGAQGAQQGKEKRRDPRTAPDEDLYVEDRPWTEGVVGNRRRREVHEGRPLERDDDEQDDDE